MRRSTLVAFALSVSFATGAVAKDKDKSNPTPPVFQAVLNCKTIADSKDRLACFDRTVESLATANSTREIMVAERATVKEAERGLFGLSLPKIKLFGGDDDEQIKEIESTITNLRRDENAALIFTIADGARWRQIDNQPIIAKAGDKIKIRKAALGSFFANINGRSGFKVTRVAN